MLAVGCKPDAPIYPASSNSYMPIAAGNTWRYAYKITGHPLDTLTVKMTSAVSVVNARQYFSATTTSRQFPQFTSCFYSGDHVYATLQAAAVPGGAVVIDLDYLNDVFSQGQTWTNKLTSDGTVNGFPGRMLGAMIQKDTTMMINGNMYPGVIHTRADVQYNFGQGFQNYITYEYYMVRGVGIARIVTAVGTDTISTQELIDFSIK